MGRPPEEQNKRIEEITPQDAWKRMTDSSTDPAPLLLDVREVWEFEEVRAKDAINIPLSQFRERYNEVPRDREILCICHLGSRSLQAARFLQRQGWPTPKNVEGGTDAWEASQLPIERGKP